MNKFTSIFGKNIKAVVKYVDLDQDGAVLNTTKKFEGKVDEQVDYDPSDEIAKYLKQGYSLVRDGFDENPIFTEDVSEYIISFRHKHLFEDVENKQVKQLVHYQGAASRTPEDSTTEVKFVHKKEIDAVDGHIIKDLGWEPESQTFMIIGTPTLPGFVPDAVQVGGDTVTADDDDKKYTVNFTVNDKPAQDTQSAVIEYVDLSNKNSVILQKKVSGQPNMQIEYDPTTEIKQLEDKGYILVDNGFEKNGDIQFFGNAEGYVPTFIITMRYDAIAVDAKHPNKAVDPENYDKTSKLTINFKGVANPPKDVVQTAHWQRTVTFAPDTGKIIADGRFNTDWTADIEHYQDVKVPQIEDYTTDSDVIKAPELSQKDQVISVEYHKIIEGDIPEKPATEASQTKDEKAEPKPVVKGQEAIINFIDVDNHGNSITSSGILTGKPGESINDLYSTENPLKIIKRAGYHVVFNSFDNGDIQKFNDNALMPQVFTIGVSKKSAADQNASVGNLTKEKLDEIKANISTSEKDDADYSKTMLELTNVVSSLYDMVAKSDKDEK